MSSGLSDQLGVRSAVKGISTDNRRRLVQVITLVLVILAWEIMGRLLGELLFAPASVVATTYIELLRGPVVPMLIVTLQDMLVGFVLAVLTALPIGVLMGRSRTAEAAFDPWVTAAFATSTSALLPLIIVLFGISFTFRIVIVWLACVWHMLITVYHGSQSVDQGVLDVSRSFGASRTKTFWSAILPAIAPYIFSAIRLGLTRSLRGIILAEFYIAHGYGGLIRNFGSTTVSTAPVLALALTLMFLGFGMRKSLEYTQYYLFPWADVEGAM